MGVLWFRFRFVLRFRFDTLRLGGEKEAGQEPPWRTQWWRSRIRWVYHGAKRRPRLRTGLSSEAILCPRRDEEVDWECVLEQTWVSLWSGWSETCLKSRPWFVSRRTSFGTPNAQFVKSHQLLKVAKTSTKPILSQNKRTHRLLATSFLLQKSVTTAISGFCTLRSTPSFIVLERQESNTLTKAPAKKKSTFVVKRESECSFVLPLLPLIAYRFVDTKLV